MDTKTDSSDSCHLVIHVHHCVRTERVNKYWIQRWGAKCWKEHHPFKYHTFYIVLQWKDGDGLPLETLLAARQLAPQHKWGLWLDDPQKRAIENKYLVVVLSQTKGKKTEGHLTQVQFYTSHISSNIGSKCGRRNSKF